VERSRTCQGQNAVNLRFWDDPGIAGERSAVEEKNGKSGTRRAAGSKYLADSDERTRFGEAR
jgi:hypothetical protein